MQIWTLVVSLYSHPIVIAVSLLIGVDNIETSAVSHVPLALRKASILVTILERLTPLDKHGKGQKRQWIPLRGIQRASMTRLNSSSGN